MIAGREEILKWSCLYLIHGTLGVPIPPDATLVDLGFSALSHLCSDK